MAPKTLTRISIKDLRLAKFGRGRPMRQCSKEFDDYLAALTRVDDQEHLVPPALGQALLKCLGDIKADKTARKAGVAFHLSKFIKR